MDLLLQIGNFAGFFAIWHFIAYIISLIKKDEELKKKNLKILFISITILSISMLILFTQIK